MRLMERLARALVVLGVFVLAAFFSFRFGGTGELWRGLEAAHAVSAKERAKARYDLTQLTAVNETLKKIQKKYVDPSRVKPRQMFLSALNQIQKEVAPVIVLHEDRDRTLTIRVHDAEKKFRVDNVQATWDVAARLRDVFAFLQGELKDDSVDLREIEWAACNGMLRTLDPHSVFLNPDAFREMTLSTSGKFGGLGIVISIRDQVLTIMRPMPGTPAGRAKLERFDRITKINTESTLNMPLDDAVDRLRGDPGTKVTIWVHRDGPDGWQGARPFTLVREQIRIQSVEHHDLGQGIGYVRIKQFQATTAAELERSLTQLKSQGNLKGIVLDLRGNPGGLLQQAAKVADRFLEDGVIVSTVGHSEGREEKKASRTGTEPDYPIVVLTNGSSASASEIVAGALKNHGRAVVVGNTTFGKGTVQLIFPRVTPDNAALKLTIAEYLTPGDVSIQGVGVAPDINLDPMTADKLEMDIFRDDSPLRERDLSKSLATSARRSTERPSFKLRYRMPMEERIAIRERGADLDDEFKVDFPIAFARDLAGKLPRVKRKKALPRVKSFVETSQEEETKAIAADLEKIGIDWSAPDPKAKGPQAEDYTVAVGTDQPGDKARAGEAMSLTLEVKNNGKAPIHRLRAVTKSDSPSFDDKELVIGKLAPGESKKVAVPAGYCEIEGRKIGSTKPLPKNPKRDCHLSKRALTRQDIVKFRFTAEGGEPPAPVELRPTIEALPRPVFAYSYQISDDRPGNGDGRLARGEGATIYLTVKNVGVGSSHETQANISNSTGDGILLRKGRFDVSNMKPGDVRRVAFTFDVMPALSQGFVKLSLSVYDRDLGVGSSEQLKIPVAATQPAAAPGNAAKARYTAGKAVPLRGQPRGAAVPFAKLEPGAVVTGQGLVDGFLKIGLGGSRFAFVEKDAMTETKRAERVKIAPLLSRSPPLLDVNAGALAVRDKDVKVSVKATDGDEVSDAYVFVGSRKVFYKSNRKAKDPKSLAFTTKIELQPGVNVITVVARENDDVKTVLTRVVRRDGKEGQALPTPKNELFGADWEFSGGN